MTPKTILLVEVKPDDLELAIRALRKSGHGDGVVVARDGVEFSQFTTMLAGVGQYWLDLNPRPQA